MWHVGHDGAGWARSVQQRHEHSRGVCTEVVDLLTCLLGQAAHDLLAAANGDPSISAAPAGGTCGACDQAPGQLVGSQKPQHKVSGSSSEYTQGWEEAAGGGDGEQVEESEDWVRRGAKGGEKLEVREGHKGPCN